MAWFNANSAGKAKGGGNVILADAPQDIRVFERAFGEATVSWTPPSNSEVPVDHYNIYLSRGTNVASLDKMKKIGETTELSFLLKGMEEYDSIYTIAVASVTADGYINATMRTLVNTVSRRIAVYIYSGKSVYLTYNGRNLIKQNDANVAVGNPHAFGNKKIAVYQKTVYETEDFVNFTPFISNFPGYAMGDIILDNGIYYAVGTYNSGSSNTYYADFYYTDDNLNWVLFAKTSSSTRYSSFFKYDDRLFVINADKGAIYEIDKELKKVNRISSSSTNNGYYYYPASHIGSKVVVFNGNVAPFYVDLDAETPTPVAILTDCRVQDYVKVDDYLYLLTKQTSESYRYPRIFRSNNGIDWERFSLHNLSSYSSLYNYNVYGLCYQNGVFFMSADRTWGDTGKTVLYRSYDGVYWEGNDDVYVSARIGSPTLYERKDEYK